MRFMLLVQIPTATDENEYMPTAEQVEAMGKYNQALSDAGVLLALDGLAPPSKGARVDFPGGKAKVTDGPFTEAKEMVGGYWVIQAQSKEEAVEWASRCPMEGGGAIEVRQIFEMSDFPEDVQAAAGELSETPREQTVER
jgi:hypothetical protein